MSILGELSGFGPKHFALFLLCVLGTLCPGVLVVCHYRPDLFIACDVVKVTFLSMGFTLPVVAFNTIWALSVRTDKTQTESQARMELENAFMTGCFATAVILVSCLYVAYVSRASFRIYTYVVVSANAGLFILTAVVLGFMQGFKRGFKSRRQ